MSMLDEVKDLLDYFNSSNLQTLKYSNTKEKIFLTKGKKVIKPSVQRQKVSKAVKRLDKSKTINSNLVGLCYLGKEPGSTPFFEEGEKVSKGDVICNIESMKIMNEIKAPIDGIFGKYLVNDGEVVDVDQPIVKLR